MKKKNLKTQIYDFIVSWPCR